MGTKVISLLGNIVCRVYCNTVHTNFKVAVVAGGVTGGAHCSDYIALIYILTDLYIKVAVVAVKSLDAVAVVYNNIVAIAGFTPYNFNNSAGRSCVDVGTIAAACNIHAGVTFISAERTAYISADGGPDEAAGACSRVLAGNKRDFSADGNLLGDRLLENFRGTTMPSS